MQAVRWSKCSFGHFCILFYQEEEKELTSNDFIAGNGKEWFLTADLNNAGKPSIKSLLCPFEKMIFLFLTEKRCENAEKNDSYKLTGV